MTRQQIQSIHLGQTGLYQWDKSLPVVEMCDVREDQRGHTFRYVYVLSATGNATIGFIVGENP
jgi:hypothetical protein